MSKAPRDPTQSTQKVTTLGEEHEPKTVTDPSQPEPQRRAPGVLGRIALKRIRLPRPE
jgi:hypothetical protein